MAGLSAVGIDLGTTYSSVAVVNDSGQPEIIPNAESERLTPSAVLFEEDMIVVGQIAKDAMVTDPDRVVMFVKRQMGNNSWYFPYDLERHGPADISAMILTKMKRDAEQYLDRLLPYAVITVPAYFDDERRRATISAGEIAGFKVLGLLNEPTAAAIAFGVDRTKKPETILVYDLGGGTFDVTIMKVDGDDISIVATDGDHQIGGKDFDDAIIKYAVEHFKNEHDFDPTTDPYVAGELRSAAENAKRQLSKRRRTMMMLRAEGKSTRIEIDQDTFTKLIMPKLNTTMTLVRSVLRDADLQPDQLDRVLLIGGSTRVLAVQAVLADYFGFDPDNSVNPDEAVALGAALMAAKKMAELAPEEVVEPIAQKVGGLQITDVTSHSLGIEAFIPNTQQRINSILIPRNSPIPTEVSKEFTTTETAQTAIKVIIYQGEFQDPKLCNPIGEFLLGGLPADRPPGRKVRVTVACTVDGVVKVSALDIETGRETTTEVSYRNQQTPEKVSAKERWLRKKKVL